MSEPQSNRQNLRKNRDFFQDDNLIAKQSEFFGNRISKRFAHLQKWAKRENIGAIRVYDRDIPEIPLRLDFFCAEDGEKFAILTLFERPYDKPEEDERVWLEAMRGCVCEKLQIDAKNIFLKERKRQRGNMQYEKFARTQKEIVVFERQNRFLLNLSDYIDCGLFFDLRNLRAKIQAESMGKSILNLFCYTGAFSVCAAKGGASRLISVDLSTKYLQWAKKNFLLNGFSENEISSEKFGFVQADVSEFLKKSREKFDIIILDPPTFSNSKKTENDMDLQKDWQNLIKLCAARLSLGGKIFFSVNSRHFKFDENLIFPLAAREISEKIIPPDFEKRFFHKVWEITAQN